MGDSVAVWPGCRPRTPPPPSGGAQEALGLFRGRVRLPGLSALRIPGPKEALEDVRGSCRCHPGSPADLEPHLSPNVLRNTSLDVGLDELFKEVVLGEIRYEPLPETRDAES